MNATEAANAFIESHFPDCLAAFVAGSVIRGDATSTSDLDMVIIVDSPEAPWRESFRESGWPIEAFVHTGESVRHYFAKEVRELRPSLPRMVAEGRLLRDRNDVGTILQGEAHTLIEQGPRPLTPEALALRRYRVTDLLDDFIGSVHAGEGLFVANDLAVAAANLMLISNGRWIGSGKWVNRALHQFDPDSALRLVDALQAYYREGSKALLVTFAQEALAGVGGRLFEGYRAGGERPGEPPA